MPDLNDAVAKANAEANEAFGKLARAVEAASKKGGTINVLEVTRQAGLEVDERTLSGLHIDSIIYIHPWLPWHFWFPWRPLWCWWWHKRYPLVLQLPLVVAPLLLAALLLSVPVGSAAHRHPPVAGGPRLRPPAESWPRASLT